MIPALISAAVAFAVLALTQWIIHRRERSRFLLTKLEELYLLLIQLGERNLSRFEAPLLIAAGRIYNPPENRLTFDQKMASDLLEKIDLIVDFYFPLLRPDLEKMFEANRECIDLLNEPRLEISPKAYERIRVVSTDFADRFGAMQKRILLDRRLLIKSLPRELKEAFDKFTYG
jgi:hypothetical protein